MEETDIRRLSPESQDEKRKIAIKLHKSGQSYFEIEKISVFYLPPYCPELNPDEYLNSHLKNKIYQGLAVFSQEELKEKVHSMH